MIRIITVGKGSYLNDAVDDFLTRIKKFIRVELIEVKEEKVGNDPHAVKRAEGERILSAWKEKGKLVCLDVTGKKYSSEQFALLIKDAVLEDITFVIGGPIGLSDEVKEKAHLLMSLSEMTFTHQMVRLFFVEQLYRAFCINRGIPYHK